MNYNKKLTDNSKYLKICLGYISLVFNKYFLIDYKLLLLPCRPLDSSISLHK